MTFYFPAPHHPWECGTNENINGLLREFFPKGKDITDTPEDYIQRKYHELNLRPRKCLGYKTPYEVYFSKVLHLAWQFAAKSRKNHCVLPAFLYVKCSYPSSPDYFIETRMAEIFSDILYKML